MHNIPQELWRNTYI